MSQALFLWVLKTWFDTLLSANALGRRKPVVLGRPAQGSILRNPRGSGGQATEGHAQLRRSLQAQS